MKDKGWIGVVLRRNGVNESKFKLGDVTVERGIEWEERRRNDLPGFHSIHFPNCINWTIHFFLSHLPTSHLSSTSLSPSPPLQHHYEWFKRPNLALESFPTHLLTPDRLPAGSFGLKRRIAHPFTEAIGTFSKSVSPPPTLTFPLIPNHLPSYLLSPISLLPPYLPSPFSNTTMNDSRHHLTLSIDIRTSRSSPN